jgi:hypothetical protein
VYEHCPFIVLSFLIRIVEALGNAAFLTASFAIIAKEFPDNVATTFVSISTITVQFPTDNTSRTLHNDSETCFKTPNSYLETTGAGG